MLESTDFTCGDTSRKKQFYETEIEAGVGGLKECSLGSECYGQTPLVYTDMAARSTSWGRTWVELCVCVVGEEGGQVEDKNRSRPDGG